MPKYRLIFSVEGRAEGTVEAPNEDAAREMADTVSATDRLDYQLEVVEAINSKKG
jgi:flagellar basal body rod protein FlgC